MQISGYAVVGNNQTCQYFQFVNNKGWLKQQRSGGSKDNLRTITVIIYLKESANNHYDQFYLIINLSKAL